MSLISGLSVGYKACIDHMFNDIGCIRIQRPNLHNQMAAKPSPQNGGEILNFPFYCSLCQVTCAFLMDVRQTSVYLIFTTFVTLNSHFVYLQRRLSSLIHVGLHVCGPIPDRMTIF